MESFFRKRHMGGKKKDNDTGRSLRHVSTHPFEEIPPSSILNIFKNQFRVRLFTLAFTHRLKWNRGSISRAHVLNYVEHIRGELTPSSTMSIPRGSMSFHEMNDNSYCLSRPFTRLVKKKISLCEKQDSQIHLFPLHSRHRIIIRNTAARPLER